MQEIDDTEAARRWLDGPREPAAFQAIDLRAVAGFASGSFAGCLFLSCDLTPHQAGFLTRSGATVIQDDPARPFPAHRAQL